ncbi:MAG: hypothetical protein JWQ00_2182, partial [Noviherbaspirillum sp.]|nr:hypothetical protein [Noviherbaspirillum sp.]
ARGAWRDSRPWLWSGARRRLRRHGRGWGRQVHRDAIVVARRLELGWRRRTREQKPQHRDVNRDGQHDGDRDRSMPPPCIAVVRFLPWQGPVLSPFSQTVNQFRVFIRLHGCACPAGSAPAAYVRSPSCLSLSRLTGFTQCSLKPASAARCLSSSWPHPVRAIRMTPRFSACALIRRAASYPSI